MTNTNISHIERGATKLSLPSLINIANALDKTADYLLMDVIHNSDVQFRKEFDNLLKDCTIEEYQLLYDVCKIISDNNKKIKKKREEEY